MVNKLLDTLKKNIDYKKVEKEMVSMKYNFDEFYDISLIIPIRNRTSFIQPLFECLKKAFKNVDKKISITIIEHCESPYASKVCKNLKINYMWIRCEKNDLFNKCLSMNVGALYGPNSKNLLFHDVDCLMQSDFFVNLFKNVTAKNARAIQCFCDRRVLYLNEQLTLDVLKNSINVDSLSKEKEGVSLPYYIGAPGGSIFVERNLFNLVGGYDDNLFQANSPEDIFFWDKIETIEKMHTCNEPKIELFHMFHRPTYYDNPKLEEMKYYYDIFKNLSVEEKNKYINEKKQKLIELS